jgi:hypothetical protein
MLKAKVTSAAPGNILRPALRISITAGRSGRRRNGKESGCKPRN